MGVWLFQGEQSYYTALQGRIRLHASLSPGDRQLAIGHQRQCNRAHGHSAFTDRPRKSSKRPLRISLLLGIICLCRHSRSEIIIRRLNRSTGFNRPEDICALSIIPQRIFAAAILGDKTRRYERKNRSYGRNLYIPRASSSSFLYHDLQIIEHR